ncbi:MAG TPA: ATP-dependent helicase, partial [Anaerolineae bacterium]
MKLRDEQNDIAEYTGGLAAVSAVPGSGKTFTLAMLAAQLLSANRLPDDGEVLVVTFTNSAVDNIRSRIRAVLKERGLIDVGYRVLTLHGLANLIVRERPDLAGTTADFRLDDDLTGPQSFSAAVRLYIAQNNDYWHSFLRPDLTTQQLPTVELQWTRATEQIGREVTRLAKNLRLRPADVWKLMGERAEEQGRRFAGEEEQRRRGEASPFLNMGAAIYERYEQILSLGGRLDFDDLIWRAIMALENDDGFRSRLGRRWPFILEDEAQDSTPLQQQILSMLSAEHNNWVRVGDPNQAIMTTFTASDVRFFREFMARDDVSELPLSVSGRSAPKIIALANRLADWAALEQPEPEVRLKALSNRVHIFPTEPGDGQPNPSDDEARISVRAFADADAEANEVAKSAIRYVLAYPDKTCAILTPTNYFGKDVIVALT